MDEFKKWLVEALPTKWSRRLSGWTLPVAALAYSLPTYLPSGYLPSSPVETFLLRLVLALSTLLLGSLAVLVLVLRHAHDSRQTPPVAKPPPTQIPKRLAALDVEILQYLCAVKFSTSAEISKRTSKQVQLIEYHLNEMEGSGHVYGGRGAMGTRWSIQQAGRAHLVRAGLLT